MSENSKVSAIDGSFEDRQIGLLARAGNHEAKLASIAVLDGYNEPVRPYDFVKSLRSRIEPGIWVPNHATVYNYFKLSLVPIGIVAVASEVSVHNTDFSLTESGRTDGLELAGALLDWSLQYPDVSIQQLLGSSSTKTLNYAANIRLPILQQLSSVDGALSETYFVNLMGSEEFRPGIATNLGALAVHGIISAQSSLKNFNPEYSLRVENEELRDIERSDEATALYAAIHHLSNLGRTAADFDEILAVAIAIDGEIDPVKVRHCLHFITREGRKKQVLDRKVKKDSLEKTRYSLNPEFIEPVQDLFERIDGIANGSKEQQWPDVARNIANDSDLLGAVLAKAKAYSFKARVRHEDIQALDNSILQIIEAQNYATTAMVASEINAQRSQLSRPAVRARLMLLCEKGLLDSDFMQIDATKKRKEQVFFLVQQKD